MSSAVSGRSAVIVLALAACGAAAPIEFTASEGDLAASARFEASGGNLVITLSNIAATDVFNPQGILTALFFDITGSAPALSPLSAVVPAGSTVAFGGMGPGNSVGGEWAYRSGLLGAPLGAQYGLSAAGFGLFGPHDIIGGVNLQGPVAPNGLEYGITSAGDDPTTGNRPVTGTQALIKYKVVFTLSGLPDDFDPSARLTNVWWQYGTSLSERGLPEPASAALIVLGAALARTRRRRLTSV